MKRLRYIPLLMLWFAALPAAAATLEAWLDRTQVAEGETVRLMLQAKGRSSGNPDLAPLQQDFDILATSSGSRMTIINGQSDASTTWTIELSPKHGGTLTIPALQAGNARSAALTLQVSAAPVAQAGSDAPVLIETELSTTRPYLQGQVIYTERLLHAVPVASGQLSAPSAEHLLVQPLGEDREYDTQRNGRRYQVVERRYALFPQASGHIELSAPVFDGEVADPRQRRSSPMSRFFGNDPFFGRDLFSDLTTPTRRMRVRGTADTLDVQPRPMAARGSGWLPATQLQLHGAWQPDSGTVKVGEPLTLQLELQAAGLTGGQLPDIVPATVDGFDVYPDQAQRSTDTRADGVSGHLQQKIAFIPRRAGTLTVPAIDVYWWDTAADREQHTQLPAHVVSVAAAPGSAAAPVAAPPAPSPAVTKPGVNATAPSASVAPAPAAGAGWWPWLSAALGAAWLLTLVLWWRRRAPQPVRAEARVPVASTTAGLARRAFLAACTANDPVNARRHLLEWAAAHWPDDPPRGLQALAQRIPDQALRVAIDGLDRALYSPTRQWNGNELAAGLQQLPPTGADAGDGKEVLAPLYPQSHQRASR